ncbi:unnamed protein product [Ectocarpus sp. 8 AP-2014]
MKLEGDYFLIGLLSSRRKPDPGQVSCCSFTPLHCWAHFGQRKAVATLLGAGIDANLKT